VDHEDLAPALDVGQPDVDLAVEPTRTEDRRVEGVEAVQAEKFQRLISPLATSLDDEVIPIGSLEIAQLANNPSFRERGRLIIEAGGGK